MHIGLGRRLRDPGQRDQFRERARLPGRGKEFGNLPWILQDQRNASSVCSSPLPIWVSRDSEASSTSRASAASKILRCS